MTETLRNICRQTLPSVAYWVKSDERRAQRFYVLICLALSSMHDRFLAVEERLGGSKNWSTTMSYYSIVHAARFLCFQALGDFPKGHGALANLLSGRRSVGLDWRQEFSGRQAGPRPGSGAVGNGRTDSVAPGTWRAVLESYLTNDLQIPDTTASIDRLAQILDCAKSLRNDSNYEALLIAHEQNHLLITEHVDRLAADMGEAARWTSELLRCALVAEVDHGPDIPEAERPAYRAMARDCVRIRAVDLIEPRLSRPSDRDNFRDYIEQFGLDGPSAGYDHLEKAIGLPGYDGLFGSKAALMQKYLEKIDEFNVFLSASAQDNA